MGERVGMNEELSFSEQREKITGLLDFTRHVIKTTPEVMREIDEAVAAKDIYQFYVAVSHLELGFSTKEMLLFRRAMAGNGLIDFDSFAFIAHFSHMKNLVEIMLANFELMKQALEAKMKKYAH